MRKYTLSDKATSEEIEAEADMVERLTGGWSRTGNLKTRTGKYGYRRAIGDPIGTEDLFARWSRTRQR